MIVADRKPVPEIRDQIQDHRKVLFLGCGTCVTVCLAGGEREIGILGSSVRMALRLIGRGEVVIDECTIERQCEEAFVDLVAPRIAHYDAVCSFGCGAGVQFLAERFPSTPVYPGLNTQFIGVLESQGVWTEKCAGCGSCRLAEFAGICPITRCAKRQLNGPCGGSRNGRCELSPDLECAWQIIYERSRALGTLGRLEAFVPPQDWSRSLDGGPRRIVREDQQIGEAARK
ncbi:MAG: methylenetetrahydrofolate reductase C-terminal domain-containing protein [Polyangiaceae bacterium]|nr:methylenetetrahydrofolate reductase C-terminal domain-containing protein [Polyangiaceae bacterium]